MFTSLFPSLCFSLPLPFLSASHPLPLSFAHAEMCVCALYHKHITHTGMHTCRYMNEHTARPISFSWNTHTHTHTSTFTHTHTLQAHPRTTEHTQPAFHWTLISSIDRPHFNSALRLLSILWACGKSQPGCTPVWREKLINSALINDNGRAFYWQSPILVSVLEESRESTILSKSKSDSGPCSFSRGWWICLRSSSLVFITVRSTWRKSCDARLSKYEKILIIKCQRLLPYTHKSLHFEAVSCS